MERKSSPNFLKIYTDFLIQKNLFGGGSRNPDEPPRRRGRPPKRSTGVGRPLGSTLNRDTQTNVQNINQEINSENLRTTTRRGRPPKRIRKTYTYGPTNSNVSRASINEENLQSESEEMEVDEIPMEIDIENEPYVTAQIVLGQKEEFFIGVRFDLKLKKSQIPPLNSTNQIHSNCITFSLFKLIKKLNLSIGLFNMDFFQYYWQKLKVDPDNYVLVWPNSNCEYFIVPIWFNRHYLFAIIESKNGVKIYMCDSLLSDATYEQSNSILAPYLKALEEIFAKCFAVRSQIDPKTPIEFINISSESPKQLNDYNCAPHVVANIKNFFKNLQTPDAQNHFLFQNNSNGMEMRNEMISDLSLLFNDLVVSETQAAAAVSPLKKALNLTPIRTAWHRQNILQPQSVILQNPTFINLQSPPKTIYPQVAKNYNLTPVRHLPVISQPQRSSKKLVFAQAPQPQIVLQTSNLPQRSNLPQPHIVPQTSNFPQRSILRPPVPQKSILKPSTSQFSIPKPVVPQKSVYIPSIPKVTVLKPVVPQVPSVNLLPANPVRAIHPSNVLRPAVPQFPQCVSRLPANPIRILHPSNVIIPRQAIVLAPKATQLQPRFVQQSLSGPSNISFPSQTRISQNAQPINQNLSSSSVHQQIQQPPILNIQRQLPENVVELEEGRLFLSYNFILGDRQEELLNPDCHELAAMYGNLEKEMLDDVMDRTAMLNVTLLVARLLQLIAAQESRRIGLISPAVFMTENAYKILLENPHLAFITKSEFIDLIFVPIHQDRIHFTILIFEYDGQKVDVTFADSFYHDIKPEIQEKAVLLLTKIYPNVTEFNWKIEKNCDLQRGEGVNCAAFAASNFEIFLEKGHIEKTGRNGYYKRFCLRNALGPLLGMPPVLEAEFLEKMQINSFNAYYNRPNVTAQHLNINRFDFDAFERDEENHHVYHYEIENDSSNENDETNENNIDEELNQMGDEDVVVIRDDVLQLDENNEDENDETSLGIRTQIPNQPLNWIGTVASQPITRLERSPPKKRKAPGEGMTLRSNKTIKPLEIKAPVKVPNRGRGRPSLNNAAAIIHNLRPDPYHVGQMLKECPYCKAMLFPNETFEKCCKNGRIKMNPLRRYDTKHEALLYETHGYTSDLSNEEKNLNAFFKQNLKRLNTLLAFGSISYKTKEGLKGGPPLQIINGNYNYNLCQIEARAGNYLKFGQLFTLNHVSEILMNLRQNPIYQRMEKQACDKILKFFVEYLRKNNAIAQGNKMAFERIQEARKQGIQYPRYIVNYLDSRKVPDVLINRDLHPRQVNVPEVPEVAVIFQARDNNIDVPELPSGIFVYPKFGNKLEVHLKNSPVLDPYLFPVVFPHGEMLYWFDLPLEDEKQAEEDPFALKGDSDLEFYAFGDEKDEALMKEKELNEDEPKRKRERKYASVREQILYRSQHRVADAGIHHLWNHNALGQLLIIKAYFEVVRNEVNYYANKVEKRTVSEKYVREHYEKLLRERITGAQLGYVLRFPRLHVESWQYQKRAYGKGLTMARKFGAPTFFITATANRNWPDFIDACKLVGLEPKNAPHILYRVFNLKLRHLMHELTGPKNGGGGILGKCRAYIASIEFQKRDNIHAHILLWIHDEDVELSSDFVDTYVSARVPAPNDTKLYNAVKMHMLHSCNEKSPCHDPKNPAFCTRYYPQQSNLNTLISSGFVRYKRLPAGQGNSFSINKKNKIFTDKDVVPYNPYLLLRWDGHINVEAVVTQGTPGYTIKYILKGGSKIFIEILKEQQKGNCPYVERRGDVYNIDEAKYQFAMSYVGAQQAYTKLNSFGPFIFSHTVIWLSVHLPNDTSIIVDDGEKVESIYQTIVNRTGATTTLTAYFKYCAEHPQETENLTYIDFNYLYLYEKSKRSYRRAKKSLKRVVAMYEVNVKNAQLLALRTILLYKKSVKSFEDAATDQDQITHYFDDEQTLDFVAAAKAMGLLESDLLWRRALDQRIGSPIRQMIFLFAQVLIEGGPNLSNPRALWDEYKRYMIPPLGNRYPHLSNEQRALLGEQIALNILDWHLRNTNATLDRTSFNLVKKTTVAGYDIVDFNPDLHGDEAINYLEGNFMPMHMQIIPRVELQNEQKVAFDTIWCAIQNAENEAQNNSPKMFFLHGAGGTGKTTLYNQLIRRCNNNNIVSCATATTGIASSLLVGGQTVHSRFRIPNDVTNRSPTLKHQDPAAKHIRKMGLLLVDEASQLHKEVFDYLLETIRSVRHGDDVSRRLIIVFGGDFRQILPIIVRGHISENYYASLIPEYSSGNIEFLCLKENRRTNADQIQFREFIQNIGVARNPHSRSLSDPYYTKIQLMDSINRVNNVEEMLDAVFPQNNEAQWTKSAICAPLNATVDKINTDMLKKMKDRQEFVYEAINTVKTDSVDPLDQDAIDAMNESMAKINETGLGLQTLRLKIGAKVFFIKNVDVCYRLCNGTPAIVTGCFADSIVLRRINVDGTQGEEISIARHCFIRQADAKTGKTLEFKRVQFPIKLAFAMTINKAQGQTLDRIGLMLNTPVFAHGHLYVAMTRVRRATDITVFHPTATDNDSDIIDNVVDPKVAEFVTQLEAQ